MSYEQDCDDYTINGDPMQDAMDYEENATYDQWDGHRDEIDWCGLQADMDDEGDAGEPYVPVVEFELDDADIPF